MIADMPKNLSVESGISCSFRRYALTFSGNAK
jgi:hypothetical protein